MKKIWFFDLDGTLADTDRDIREAWKATLADLEIECPDFERDFVAGPPIEVMAETLFPGIYTPQLGDRLRQGFGAHYDHDGFPNTREYPGIIDRVRAIKSAGAKVYIATNKRYVGAMLIAKKFGWEAIFDGIYASDMYKDDPAIGKLKKPTLLAKILHDLELNAADCVMVGDTISDFDAARINGIQSIAVTWGYGTTDEFSHADRIVDSPWSID